MSGRSPQSFRARHAAVISVSHFDTAGSQPSLDDLPVPSELAEDLSETLRSLGYDTVTLGADPLPSKDLGQTVREQWEQAGADDLLIVHVLSHGHAADGDATVYVLGSDGTIDENADVAHWLASLQNVGGRPLTLLLLDLCSSGTAARLPWQQGVPAEDSRAWVIAACPPGLAAFDGRFTQAVARVLRALGDGELDTDPARPHVPLTVVARSIRQEVNRLTEEADGDQQQVTASLVDLSADPDLPFFDNPNYRTDRQARLRAAVDPGLLPFLDDLDEGLDPRHFLERAAGVGGLADSSGEIVGCFTGRDRQLSQLSRWMNNVKDELLNPGTLCVVTGSPGVGKSALLGILVCAAHYKLREPTRPVWDRAAQVPHPVDDMAAVHARGRSVASIVASVSRQLGMQAYETAAALADALCRNTGPTPVVVIDAVDEADDGPGLTTGLLLPLSAKTRLDGHPAVRLLVGVRQYEEYEPLLAEAQAQRAVINLDAVPAAEVEDNLNRYVTDLLRTTTAYRRRGAVTGAFAGRLASVLTTAVGGEDVRWGPFLVAGLYTRHIIATTAHAAIETAERAELAAEEAPRDLPSVLELDLRARADQPWLRTVMSVLGHARGQGMPLSVIARCTACYAVPPVAASLTEVRQALDAGRVYLRQSVDGEGTTVYRLFHQGLADTLAPRPFTKAAELLTALLAPLGPPHARDWDAAEPYVLRHVLDHAEDAGLVSAVLDDPALLMRPEAAGLLRRADLAANPRLRAIAAIVGNPPAAGSRLGWALAAARLGLTDLADRIANLPPPLPWRLAWRSIGRDRESQELMTNESPIAALDMSADGRFLVSYDESGGLRIWDLGDGTPHGAQLSSYRATAVAVSPNGRFVVTGDASGRIRVWNVSGGTSRHAVGKDNPIAAVAISDDANCMAFYDDGTFVYWDRNSVSLHMKTGIRPIYLEWPFTQPDGVSHLVADTTKSGHRYLVAANPRGTVGLLPVTRLVLPAVIHEGTVTSVAWSESMIVLGFEDGAVLLWKREVESAGHTLVIGQHEGSVRCVAVSSDGLTVASGGTDGSLRVWHALPGRTQTDSGTRAENRMMAVTDDAVLMVARGLDVYPLALRTGKLLGAPAESGQPATWLSTQVIDGRQGVLLHHADGRSSLWLPGANSLIDAGIWPGTQPSSAAPVIVLGNRLVEIVADASGTLAVRDIASERKASRPWPRRVPRNGPALVACGRVGGRPVAASCAIDGDTVFLWDVASRRLTDTIAAGGRVWGLGISSGDYLLVGVGDEVIALRHTEADQS